MDLHWLSHIQDVEVFFHEIFFLLSFQMHKVGTGPELVYVSRSLFNLHGKVSDLDSSTAEKS